MQQMMDNLTKVKKASKEWGKNFRSWQQSELNRLEEGIKELYKENDAGVFSEEELKKLK